MVDSFSNVPPPPEGFELMKPGDRSNAIPPPPPGFELMTNQNSQARQMGEVLPEQDRAAPVAELPKPSEQIYEGVQPEDQEQIYKAYEKHPLSKRDEQGNLFYNDLLVPPPQGPRTWSFQDANMDLGLPNTFQDAVGGVWNASRNVIESSFGIRDSFTGKEDQKSVSGFLDTVYPKYDNPDQTAVGNVVEEVASFAVPGGLAAKATKGTKGLNAARALFTEAAGLMGIDPDTQPLVADQVISSLLEIDNNDEDVFLNKLGLLTEGLVIAKGAEYAARGAIGFKNLIKDYLIAPLKGIGNEAVVEDTIMKDLLKSWDNIRPGDTPEEVASRWEREIVNPIDQGRQDTVSTGIEDIGDLTVKRDTVSSFEKGMEDLGIDDPKMVNRARSTRSSAMNRDSPDLETKIKEPSRQGKELFDMLEAREGGPQAVTATREGIQENIQRQTDESLREIDQTKQKIIDSEESVQTLLKEDITFGPLLDDLSKQSGVDINTNVQAGTAADKIVDQINEASVVMTTKKNDLYKAIPNAKVNTDALNSAIEESDKFLTTNLRKQLGEASDNFVELQEFASFDLQRAIKESKAANDWERADALRNLHNHITNDQLDFLIQSGNKETADAAKEAKRYYTEEYAPFWRDGRLEDLQNLQRDLVLKPINRKSAQRGVVTKALSDPENPEFTVQIAELLKTSEGGENPGLLLDYALGRMARNIRSKMNRSNELPSEIDDYIKSTEDLVEVFKNVDPDLLPRVNNFLTALRNSGLNKKALQQELKTLEENFLRREEELAKSPLKVFFEGSGETKIFNQEDSEIFKKIFSNPEVNRDLPRIIREAGPEKLNGLRAAYQDYLSSKIFRSADNLELAPLKDDELDRLLRAGKLLYKDTPEVVDAVEFFVEEMKRPQKGSNKTAIFDTSSLRKGGSGVADFIITQIWGPLNRWGARIRSGTGRVLAQIDPKDFAEATMRKILIEPEEFSRIARRVIEQEKSKDALKLDPTLRSDIYRFFITPLYTSDPENYPSEREYLEAITKTANEETDEAFQ